MSQSLRIVAADDDPAMCYFYEQTLPRLGHQVHIARDGRQLVQMCRAVRPDLVLADVKMPGLDGIEAVQEINREREVPAILVSAYDDLVIADVGHIMGYLVKPVRPADLNAAITLALARFEQLRQLGREAADLRQALEDRKLVERAKGAIMCWTDLDEAQAYHGLRKVASNQNRKLVDVARDVLEAAQVFVTLDKLGG